MIDGKVDLGVNANEKRSSGERGTLHERDRPYIRRCGLLVRSRRCVAAAAAVSNTKRSLICRVESSHRTSPPSGHGETERGTQQVRKQTARETHDARIIIVDECGSLSRVLVLQQLDGTTERRDGTLNIVRATQALVAISEADA